MTSTVEPATDKDIFTRDSLFIAGSWDRSGDRTSIDVVDPFSEEVIGTVPRANADDADRAIAAAVEAFRHSPWQELSYAERAATLDRIADELEARDSALVDAYVHDLGGARSFGTFVTQQSVLILREHKAFAEQLQDAPQWRENGGERNLIVREPVGPLLAIVPWNAPLVLAIVKIAPALLAGCPVVVKVATETPLASFILADAIEAAGLPAGMISFLPGDRSDLGDVASRPEFAHIAFTGSSASGVQIMKSAAENITGVTLELGGKSAGIFLDDIAPSDAAPLVVPGSLAQSGQVCTTYSRLLIPASREKEWKDALIAVFQGITVGDPNDPSTMFGPLATDHQRTNVEKFIATARDEGASILTGGGRPSDQPTGFFVEPTLVADVSDQMQIVRDEVFGPVITVQTYDTEDEAVAISNSSEFGLAAGIFTTDTDRGIAVAKRLEAGSIGINNFGACLVQPFGGYKKSGLGREGGLENVEALLEFKQIRMPMQLPS